MVGGDIMNLFNIIFMMCISISIVMVYGVFIYYIVKLYCSHIL